MPRLNFNYPYICQGGKYLVFNYEYIRKLPFHARSFSCSVITETPIDIDSLKGQLLSREELKGVAEKANGVALDFS